MEEWKLGNETDDANMVIDQKLRQYFDGRIVRKDLTKSIKEGANVPVYVLEFLLGQYCSSDDDEVIEKGVQNVKRILSDNFVRPDESQKVLSLLRERGSFTVIDRLTVKLNIKYDRYEADLSNLGIKNIPIAAEYVSQYQRGVWSMKKILFVCHGNICRSPMAEYIMRDLVKKAGLEDQFQIASAATSREEIGNPVYPPARRKLAEHGISCGGHAARQLRNSDYEEYDLLIGMDRANLRNMYHICGGDFSDKMHLLMEYAGHPEQEVADPWYTDDFDATWRDVLAGCQGLLDNLLEKWERASY